MSQSDCNGGKLADLANGAAKIIDVDGKPQKQKRPEGWASGACVGIVANME